MEHWIDVQLNVDASAGLPQDVTYLWFDSFVARIAGAERAALAHLPATAKMAGDPGSVLDEPGSLFGVVEVQRPDTDYRVKVRRRALSDAGLRWLRGELADYPQKVIVKIAYLDAEGRGMDTTYRWEATMP